MRFLSVGLAFLLLGAPPALSAPGTQPPDPRSFLGFQVGADRKLADWSQIVAYFEELSRSDRVLVENVGETTEGRPFLVATISSAENMARLDAIRTLNLRLADPRGLGSSQADRLVASGKTIVAMSHGIHSTEVGPSQMAMELAYRLATSQEPELLEILDQTVVLMIPSHNPDGTQKVVEWYRQSVGSPYEGGSIPFLYHHYTGHDNNRDWYMFTQAESRLTARFVYDRWRPQIVHDLHQMGTRGARIFVPPYVDPWEPNVDPALVAAANALGVHMAARLISEGKPGVLTHAIYDAWTPARAYPHTHGGVRVLSECASARLASPIEVRFEDLEGGRGYDPQRASWNFPLPWKGGTWRLRDIVDYELSASLALLAHAARNRRFWLDNFLRVNRRAASRSQPFAFVLPAAQRDPLATAKLLDVMRLGGVEVHRARDRFWAGGVLHQPGAHVIRMAQPFSAFAKTLLEPQRYPTGRLVEGAPPQRPYDVTAHTLPLMMGVEVAAVTAPFQAPLELLEQADVRPGSVVGAGAYLALGHTSGDLIALGRLLREGVEMRWATEPFTDRGRSYPAGTLLAPGSTRSRLAGYARELGVTAHGVDAAPAALRLHLPRVGLYQSWVASTDEGWTRFVFERQVEVEYETLHDADIRAGRLQQRFDVIVLPDQPAAQILNGHSAGALPDEYVGGLGGQGAAQLEAFVTAGGTLIALNRASELAIAELDLPVTNVLAAAGDASASGFSCPGAILSVRVDPAHPLAHGLEDPASVWFENGPAFVLTAGTTVAAYAEENPLRSGWIQGSEQLQGRAALVDIPHGRGRVVLFGFRPQFRAQTWATYVPLLNAIYTAAATPAP